MGKEFKLAIISALIGSIASLLLGYLFGYVGKQRTVKIEQEQVTQAVEQLSNDESFKKSIAKDISARPHDYDSGWFSIRLDETETKDTGFNSLPTNFTAYYRRANGHVFPWGMNQYGDGYQSNGVLLDFSEDGKIYVRTSSPVQSHTGHLLHVGAYRNREDTGAEKIFHVKSVEFRIIAWK